MNETATLNGQDINEAARAVRRVLNALLDDASITFAQWVALRALVLSGPSVERDALRDTLAHDLEVTAAAAAALVDQLVSAGLARAASSNGGRGAVLLEPTQAGEALIQHLQAAIGRATAELYSGLAPSDLVTTRRVLQEVTQRATARVAR